MILSRAPLAMHWPTLDPFLFCAHHNDHYPAGNGRFGPVTGLQGRPLGSDFSGRDGWSMYHGQQTPGFPAHPHRGFETVTVVRRGRIDHADSLGAAARFGDGDVQWLTAGRGIVHAEMFPLLREDAANPLELFQIWLNLPAKRKMCAPSFQMLWAEDIPRRQWPADPPGAPSASACAGAECVVVAGRLDAAADADGALALQGLRPLAPPPDSWARESAADVGIFTIRLSPGGRFTLPPAASAHTLRVAYFFAGEHLTVDGQAIKGHAALQVDASQPLRLGHAGQPGVDADVELLVLQGRPIGEPVAQHGPFVMNTDTQIREAFADYQRTRFGGWPWPDEAPVHGEDAARFARLPDGQVLRPPGRV